MPKHLQLHIPDKEILLKQYQGGMSQRDLADYYKLSRHIIRRWFLKYSIIACPTDQHKIGGVPKGVGRINIYSKEELILLYEKPMSVRAVAKHFGVSESKVRRDFDRWGLEHRTGGQIKRLSSEERLINLKTSRRQWVNKNKSKAALIQKTYKKRRLQNDLDYRLLHNLRSRAYSVLKSKVKGKSKLVGCTGAELRGHLESLFLDGMNWDNYGYDGWHIDHVVPCSYFDLNDPQDICRCFHYSNLQPLWAEDNFKKSDSLG
jgi:transposase